MKKKIIIGIFIGLLILGNIILIVLNHNKNSNLQNKDNNLASTNTISNSNITSSTNIISNSNNIKNSNSSMQIYESNNLKYWLYIPQNAKENMPLIVYLHGNSDKGDDPNIMLEKNSFTKWIYNGEIENLNSYVLIPQLKTEYKGWTSAEEDLMSVINETIEKYKINKNNIILTGFSIGGTGTWIIGSRHTDIFKKIAPLAGAALISNDLKNNLTKIDIWAFIGLSDTIIDPKTSQEVISTIKSNQGNAKITEFEGTEHTEVPKKAILETDLIKWLIGE